MPASNTGPTAPLPASQGAVYGQVHRPDGQPVPEAVLTLIDQAGHQLAHAVSQPDGGYHLPVPHAGTSVLLITAAAHQPHAATLNTTGAEPTRLDITLAGAASLTGQLTQTATTTPIGGATLTLTDHHGQVLATSTSGPDGHYHFSNLVAGTYTLVASSQDHQPTARNITLPETGETQQPLQLAARTQLHGTVQTSSSGPIPDARVTLLDQTGTPIAATTTDHTGRYQLTNLPAGPHTLIASGYPPVADTLQVTGTALYEHDIELGHPHHDHHTSPRAAEPNHHSRQ